MTQIQILNLIPKINWIWWFDIKMVLSLLGVALLYIVIIDQLKE